MEFASASCTLQPKDPFYLMGYVQRSMPAQGIHDYPQVNTAVVSLAGHRLVICIIDVCVISREVSNQIKKDLIKKFDLDFLDITLTALHSHSCPGGTQSNHNFGAKNDDTAFLTQVKNAVSKTVAACLSNLQPASALIRKTPILGCFSNRNDLQEKYDNEIIEIEFYHQRQLLGVLLSVPCHSTVLGPNNDQCSSDLIGALRNQMAAYLKTSVIAFMAAAGDISTRQYRQSDDFMELERVSAEIFSQLKERTGFSPLSLTQFRLNLLEHTIDYDGSDRKEELYQIQKETEALLADPGLSHDQRKLSMTTKAVIENKLKNQQVHLDVITKVYHLGGLVLVAFGSELSSILGLRIKAACACPVVFMTPADEDLGYFIEADKYGQYYETIASDVPIGFPEKIVDAICGTIKQE